MDILIRTIHALLDNVYIKTKSFSFFFLYIYIFFLSNFKIVYLKYEYGAKMMTQIVFESIHVSIEWFLFGVQNRSMDAHDKKC